MTDGAPAKTVQRALLSTLVVLCTVTLLSYLLPERHAATGVGLCFLLATHFLALRGENADVSAHGLSLGGLLEAEPLEPRRLLLSLARALGWALLLGLVVFPPFWLGWLWFYRPEASFALHVSPRFLDEALGHVFVVALPEEAFFRGYLQSELETAWPARHRLLGAGFGLAVIVTSAIFALGHLATELDVNRLGVFFPSLLFGWLRTRTRGVGPGIAFHAACNVFASFLAGSYGLAR